MSWNGSVTILVAQTTPTRQSCPTASWATRNRMPAPASASQSMPTWRANHTAFGARSQTPNIVGVSTKISGDSAQTVINTTFRLRL